MRIGLLNNSRSGRNAQRASQLMDTLADHPNLIHIETPDAGAVPGALWEFANKGVDLLVVNGGDGTLQRVLTELLANYAFGDRPPLIAPLRGGRTNMTALDLGTQRNSAKALADLVHAARKGCVCERIEKRRVLRIEQGVQGKVHYGMFFGAGTIPRAIDLVHSTFPDGRAQGVFGGTVVTAGLLARLGLGRNSGGVLSPDNVRVALDGRRIRADRFNVLMATSVHRLFAGMRPFWGQGPGGVRLTAIAEGAKGFLRATPGILRGKPAAKVSEANGYVSRNVHHAELVLDCNLTVDGELFETMPHSRVTVTADDTVRFVRA